MMIASKQNMRWTVIVSNVMHINRRHPVLLETGRASGSVSTGIIGWLGIHQVHVCGQTTEMYGLQKFNRHASF